MARIKALLLLLLKFPTRLRTHAFHGFFSWIQFQMGGSLHWVVHVHSMDPAEIRKHDPTTPPPEEIQFRCMKPADTERLIQILPRSLDQLRKKHRRIKLTDRLEYGRVALEKDRIIGAVWMVDMEPDYPFLKQLPAPLHEPVTRVTNLFIYPSHRGTGLGLRLLQDAIHWQQEKGTRTITSLIEEHNDASLRVHRSVGFRPLLNWTVRFSLGRQSNSIELIS